jgi:histidyl-tRNA synthetase
MGRKPKINKDWLQTPKGTKDIFGADYRYRGEIRDKAESIASYYGFSPIATPHIEKEELFTKTLGETSDVIEKQMFAIKTRGGDRLVLRPEGTAGITRAYFEHGMHALPQPVMLYYEGSFFRHEKPQRGRLREFSQFGLEVMGDEDAIADALTIRVISLILSEIGIKSFVVNINSIGDKECAPLYKKDLVAFFRKMTNRLCKDCKKRLRNNPLRVLDCKEEKCAQVREEAPQMFNYLCEECKKHLKNLLEHLDVLEIPYFLDNFLVRGFDYYSRTVFEFFEEKTDQKSPPKEEKKENEIEGPKIAIAAGGRYDYLGDILGNRHIPSVGGAIGIERILKILKEQKIKLKQDKPPKVFLIQLGDLAKRKNLVLMEELRKAHIPARHSLSKDNIRNQLKLADTLKVGLALIIGQKEALEEKAIVRDMETGSQEILHFSKVVNYIKEKI